METIIAVQKDGTASSAIFRVQRFTILQCQTVAGSYYTVYHRKHIRQSVEGERERMRGKERERDERKNE